MILHQVSCDDYFHNGEIIQAVPALLRAEALLEWRVMLDGCPLSPGEREEYEADLISFCDHELDRLGDIRGLDVLYAGGSSLLWLEGLSQRIGEDGNLTALEVDGDRVEAAKQSLPEAELRAPVRLVVGDVFEMPFEDEPFDLAYSAGLFHELDVREEAAERALEAMTQVTRPGGQISTGDFVDAVPSLQVEEERLQADLLKELFGRELYGIGPPERLVALHEKFLTDIRWSVSPPHRIRHLSKLFLNEEPPTLHLLAPNTARAFRMRYGELRERVRREGFTRPASLYVEGIVDG